MAKISQTLIIRIFLLVMAFGYAALFLANHQFGRGGPIGALALVFAAFVWWIRIVRTTKRDLIDILGAAWAFWPALAWARELFQSNQLINLLILAGFTVSATIALGGFLVNHIKRVSITPRQIVALSLSTAVCFTLVFSLQTWMKYNSFRAYWMDLGYMLHPMWNTAQGNWFEYFYVDGSFRSSMGDHFSLIFIPVAVIFKVFPYAYTLFFIQALAGAVGGILLFILTKQLLGNDRLAYLLQCSFYLYAPLQYGMITDFHADPLGVPFLFLLLLGFQRRDFKLLLAGFILSLSVKEHVGLVIAPLLLVLAMLYRPWRLALFSLGIGGVAYSLAAWTFFIPYFNQGEEALSLAVLYPGGHDGLGGIVRHMAAHPLMVLQKIMSLHNFEQMIWLLLPLLFLPALAFPHLLSLSIFLMKELYGVFVMHNHHQALMAPLLFWCLLVVMEKMKPFRRAQLGIAVAMSCLCIGFLSGESPLSHRFYRAGPDWYFPSEHSKALNAAVKTVPRGKSVSADSHIAIHLYNRRNLHVFPHPFPDDSTDFVLIDRTHKESGIEIRYITWKGRKRPSLLATFDSLKTSDAYECIYQVDGIEVLRKVESP